MKKYILFLASIYSFTVYGQISIITYDSYGNRLSKSITGTNPQPIISGDSIKCKGDNMQLFASGGSTYQWSTGSNQNSITVLADTTRTYSVTAFNNMGCSKTVSRKVIVNPLPVTSVITGDSIVYAGSKTIYSVSQHTNSFYDWGVNHSNNSIIGGYSTNQVSIQWGNVIGTDSIRIQERDNNTNCFGKTVYKKITIKAARTEMVVSVYPNPSNGDVMLKVTLPRAEKIDVSIVDNLGRVLRLIQDFGNDAYQIKLKRAFFPSAGIYYIHVSSENEKKVSQLTIIK